MKFARLDEIGVVWIGNACNWRPETVRRAYELVIESWVDAGVEPQQIAAVAPGVGKRYGAFRQKRQRVEKAGFENIEMVAFGRLPEGFPHGCTRWEMEADINRRLALFVVGCVPSLIGRATRTIYDNAREFIVLSECRYCYMIRQRKLFEPGANAYSLSTHVDNDWRPDDLRLNVQRWNPDMKKLAPLIAGGILRNVYPENYLSQPHLEARLGKTNTTLKEWIKAHPDDRGTLECFSDTLTKWTPPIEKMPQIREELYRAGRVFYWRFMRPAARGWHGELTAEPYYRPDLSAPWEAPDPIPEIFRADYWKDKDPGLTY